MVGSRTKGPKTVTLHARMKLSVKILSSGTPTFFLLIGICTACSTKDTDSGAGPASVDTDADRYTGPPVSYEEALTEVLVPSCGFDSCHGSGAGYLRIYENQTEAAWLEMNSNVLPGRQMVIPGNAANSYLIKKMENSTDIAGEGMPPPAGGLSGYRIGMVRSWIDNIQ